MALQSSGPISLSDLNAELGRSANTPISLGEDAVRELFGIPSGIIRLSDGYGKSSIMPTLVYGQQSYTSPGIYGWIAPAGVNSVSVVCIGAGGSGSAYGGAGGALAWKNQIKVTPGQSYTVMVGATNTQFSSAPYKFIAGQSSFSGDSHELVANGGWGGMVGGYTVGTIGSGFDGGGIGGIGSRDFYQAAYGYRFGAGGGAGGYTGPGGAAGYGPTGAGANGSGGGGGGGTTSAGGFSGNPWGGGGVGLLGQGADGDGGAAEINTPNQTGAPGLGGSGGGDGLRNISIAGGLYGGGGPGNGTTTNNRGAPGAVRLIWGDGRSFPSLNTGDF